MVFGDGPGTAVGGLGIKNAGIKGIGMGFGEPLLDGEIVSDFFVRIKCPSDNGICPVCTNEKSGRKGAYFFLFQIGNDKAAVFSLQFRTDGIAVDFHSFGNDGFQPQVEFMSVQIDIKPLIMADEPVFQVDGLDGKYLRIDQHIFWQSQIEGCQCLLCITGNQAAAGLLKTVVSKNFLIDGNDLIFRA